MCLHNVSPVDLSSFWSSFSSLTASTCAQVESFHSETQSPTSSSSRLQLLPLEPLRKQTKAAELCCLSPLLPAAHTALKSSFYTHKCVSTSLFSRRCSAARLARFHRNTVVYVPRERATGRAQAALSIKAGPEQATPPPLCSLSVCRPVCGLRATDRSLEWSDQLDTAAALSVSLQINLAGLISEQNKHEALFSMPPSSAPSY